MPRGVRSRVYIGRLPYRASQRDVERFFRGFGDIVDIQLKNGYGFVDFSDPRDAEDAVYDKNGRDLCGDRVIVELARGTPHGRDLDRDRSCRRRNRSRSRSKSRSRSPPPRRRSRSPRRRSPSPRRQSNRRSFSRSRSKSPSRSKWSRSRSRSRSPNRDSGEVRSAWRLDVENLSNKVTWQDLKEHCNKGGRVVYSEILGNGKGFVEFASEGDLQSSIEALQNTELCGKNIHVAANSASNGVARSRSHSRSHSGSRSRSHSASPRNNGNWNNNFNDQDG